MQQSFSSLIELRSTSLLEACTRLVIAAQHFDSEQHVRSARQSLQEWELNWKPFAQRTQTYVQNYHDSAIKVSNWAFYSNHVTTCGLIAASFFCYKSATSMLICCPIYDKMVLSAVSACLIADYLYPNFCKSSLHLLVFCSLIHFHKSSPTLLHGIDYTSLSFACPINENNQRRTCNMYLHMYLDLNLAAF